VLAPEHIPPRLLISVDTLFKNTLWDQYFDLAKSLKKQNPECYVSYAQRILVRFENKNIFFSLEKLSSTLGTALAK
jgi:hypothetical protein